MRRESRALITAALGLLAAIVCGGCAPAAIQFAPLALQASEAVGAGTLNLMANHAAAKSGAQGEDDFARGERCDELRDGPPGIIELRTTEAGAQWRAMVLDHSEAAPRWVIDGAESVEWRPVRNLGVMEFSPPLALKPASISYLAYAPTEPENENDTDQLNGWRAEFDVNSGSFNWRDRSYTYSVVSTLPCFPSGPGAR